MDLVLTSNILYLDILNPEDIIETKLDDIIITEQHQRNLSFHGEYKIILKQVVNTREEMYEFAEKLNDLCRRIGRLLTYVIGYPLTKRTSDFYGIRKQIILLDEIDGWDSNYKKLNRVFQKIENPKQHIFGDISSEMKHWSQTENTPLHELIPILQKYKTLDEIFKILIRFHSLALCHGYDVKYLLLGKCLEIAEALLPVPYNRKRSFQLLPVEIKNVFKKKTISWLYEMSNTRFETRHIINKKSPNNLLKEMDDQEYFDFMYLSDMMLNYIIRRQFGLEPRIFKIE